MEEREKKERARQLILAAMEGMKRQVEVAKRKAKKPPGLGGRSQCT
jgi:hypothetical protein